MQGSKIVPQAEREGTSTTSLVLVVGVLLAIAAFFVVTTASLDPLLGESSYAAISAFHGLSAGVMLVVWLVSWAILHYALRKRDRPLKPWAIGFLAGIGVATTLLWPPVFEFLAGA